MRQLMPSRSPQDRSESTSDLCAATDEHRVVVAALVITVVILALQAASQAIDFKAYHLRVVAFNADKHYSVFGLVSLLAQFAVASASARRARVASQHPFAWYVLAALAAILVIIRGLTTFNASVVALPLAAVFALLMWLTWRDGRTRVLIWAGLALLIVS